MPFYGFCKIDGIDGESNDQKHKNWIEVLSYSFGTAQAGGAEVGRVGGLTGGGKPVLSDFSIVKVLDKSSPNLFKHCCSGKHVKKVEIELCAHSENPITYMKYTLNDVIISSVRPGGASNSEGTRPLEEVGFRFADIETEYTPYDSKGKAQAAVKAAWNVAEGKSR